MVSSSVPKLNVSELKQMKENRKKVALTVAYDYSIAKAAQVSQLDGILVGDSGGMVNLGYSSTVPTTLIQMITFCQAVSRGAPEIFLIGDLPFGSYEVSSKQAVKSAIKLIKIGGVNSIKLEGGTRVANRIKAIVDSGIPVMGHLGITPQSSANISGYRPYGKNKDEILALKKDMLELENAGVFSILLEGVASEITTVARNWVNVPVYGIGSGADVDGQLVLSYDILGLYPDFKPKFAKKYVSDAISNLQEYTSDLGNIGFFDIAVKSFELYKQEILNNSFPSEEYKYSVGKEKQKLLEFARGL
jgi:3-methyl-2-oxobutanoate hydroxymethyltransferase